MICNFLNVFFWSRERELRVTVKNCMSVLSACIECDIDDVYQVASVGMLFRNRESNYAACEQGFEVYQMLKRNRQVSNEVFLKTMQLCAKLGKADMAVDVFGDYQRTGFVMPEEFVTNCLIAIARNVRYPFSPVPVELMMREIDDLLKVFMHGVQTLGWTATPEYFSEMAITFSHLGETDNVLGTLSMMTELGHEPTIELCLHLMDNALRVGDSGVLELLCDWHDRNFIDHRLPLGTIQRLIQVRTL